MGRLWRIHHPGETPAEGSALALDSRESHHLLRVLRLRPGDALGLFDGRGSEWHAVIEETSGGTVVVRIGPPITEPIVEPSLDLGLIQAQLKGDRMEWILQKATEIGVARVRVLRTVRSEGHPVTPRHLERWRRILIESCKQCGRRRVPELDAQEVLPPAGGGAAALLLDPAVCAEPIETACALAPPPGGAWLLSGPEGGFDGDEIFRFSAAGWRRVRLGPRVLRADTAGLVAAAIVLHRWGDLGRSAV